MRTLSLAALTILDAGPAGQIRAASAAGWRNVGLRLRPLVETDETIVGRPEREREIRALLGQTGVCVLEIGVFAITPNFALEELSPILDFCAQIGGRLLVSPVEDIDLSRRADNFAHLAQAAQTRGLRALVEFNPYSACRSLAEACALLERADAQEAGLCLDALHLFRSGGSPADLSAVAPDRFGLLHFCDAAAAPAGADPEALRRESRAARRLPGDGALPLRALLAALPTSLPISLEAPSPHFAGLSAEVRARAAFEATTRWLAVNDLNED